MTTDDIKKSVVRIQESIKIELQNLSRDNQLLEELDRQLSEYIEFREDKNNRILQDYNEIGENKYPLDMVCIKLAKLIMNIDKYILKFSQILSERKKPNNSIEAIGYGNFWNSSTINELREALQKLLNSNLLTVFPILRLFKGHNKTLIVMGPNGSGKTSLANYLKNASDYVKVIPANKPILLSGNVSYIYTSTLDSFNSELYSNNTISNDLLQKLIIAICSEHDSIARNYYKENKEEKKTSIFIKVKEVFENFFEIQLDESEFGNKEVKGMKEGILYDFNQMSDGERVAFFYIATVLAAPSRSFIIVDEPENHLNPAVYNKIWDKLLELRDDCQFIFMSHTMEFINARSNFEIVKIKNFLVNYENTGIPKFEFDFLGNSLDNIDSNTIVEVVGSRKPILFCEGSKADYDYKVYESIFGETHTIIPTGNSKSVINSVIACNSHSKLYSIQTAIGIIDSDIKSDMEMTHLESMMIYTLACNEIEMLLLDEEIFKKVLERQYKDANVFSEFKKLFFNKLNTEKKRIIKRMVKTQIDERLNNSFIDDKRNKTKKEIENNLDNIFKSIDVENIWLNCSRKMEEILEFNSYEKALRYCSLEHGEIVGGITNKFVPEYAIIALGVLKDYELSGKIKTKYFDRIQ